MLKWPSLIFKKQKRFCVVIVYSLILINNTFENIFVSEHLCVVLYDTIGVLKGEDTLLVKFDTRRVVSELIRHVLKFKTICVVVYMYCF